MKRLVLILMLTTAALSSYAQRGSKGQHTAAFTYGCNFTADKAWTTSLSYSNYRLYGTLDADFTYNHCEGSYKTYGAPVNNYMFSGGYSQRLIQNYRRTFILYAGINAAKAAKDAKVGALTLDHIAKFEKEIADAGIDTAAVSPKLLPDYTRKV